VAPPEAETTLGLGEGAQSGKRGLGIDKLVRDIELHVGDALGIGRPPIGRAQFQLLGIHPIRFAIQQSGAAVVGEARELTAGDFERVQIMAAAERHARAIRRELGIALGFGRGRELFPGASVERIEKQVATDAQQQPPAGLSPLQAVFAHATILPVEALRLGHRHRGLFERSDGEQRLFRFRGNVKQHDFGALEIGEMFAIRRPYRLWRFAVVTVLDHRFDGKGLLLREERNGDDAEEKNQADRHLL
jgi:hypothetical protein